MKVGIKLGKVKKFRIGWCIPRRMAADNPPASNRVNSLSNKYTKKYTKICKRAFANYVCI